MCLQRRFCSKSLHMTSQTMPRSECSNTGCACWSIDMKRQKSLRQVSAYSSAALTSTPASIIWVPHKVKSSSGTTEPCIIVNSPSTSCDTQTAKLTRDIDRNIFSVTHAPVISTYTIIYKWASGWQDHYYVKVRVISNLHMDRVMHTCFLVMWSEIHVSHWSWCLSWSSVMTAAADLPSTPHLSALTVLLTAWAFTWWYMADPKVSLGSWMALVAVATTPLELKRAAAGACFLTCWWSPILALLYVRNGSLWSFLACSCASAQRVLGGTNNWASLDTQLAAAFCPRLAWHTTMYSHENSLSLGKLKLGSAWSR